MHPEPDQIMSSVERRGWEQGYEVGLSEGITDHLTKLLELRFLDVPYQDLMVHWVPHMLPGYSVVVT